MGVLSVDGMPRAKNTMRVPGNSAMRTWGGSSMPARMVAVVSRRWYELPTPSSLSMERNSGW